ncbi:adenosylcobinamide-GDP ribazoletransferase [Massilia varians]|uniref:Adenosylcobinamide-GDP ribazoletransferase n=1 Tax=Massilia varians TaxID=457921 RepID=A0ABM8C2T6_9BURK|nr:adenosylcobinamide-GDP ribazoletransferase [Massilia varians]BDT57487.1 adenosylcobinamide-GDP ribazoletransferase [Massilia varians]
MRQLRLFFIAVQFFTRLPIPRWVGFEQEWLHHASRYFPLVGLVVGAIAAGVYAAAALVLPAPVAAVLSTAATIYATGAFHEDGFADTCDGLGGGMTRERVLEIMKDPRVGAYGAIGVVCMLGAKCSALAMLPPSSAIGALLLAHPLSRLAATSLIWRMEYARAEGKAKPLAERMTTAEFTIAAATVALAAAILLMTDALDLRALLAALVASIAATWWLARKFARRIGGYTGDCLGAVQQLAEVAIYLAVLATLGHGALA